MIKINNATQIKEKEGTVADKVIISHLIKERIMGPFIDFTEMQEKIKNVFKKYRERQI